MRRLSQSSRAISAYIMVSLLVHGCGIQKQTRILTEPNKAETLDKRSPYLKAHLRNGNVHVLSQWSVAPQGRVVSGEGTLLDANRQIIQEGKFAIPIDSVAIFETNVVQTSPSVTALPIVAGVTAAVTLVCIANPKACFGSCPTFYVSDGSKPVLQAEGFSASVSPALEAQDIDALYRARPTGRNLEVRMSNEALETHVLRYVNLLAARRPPNGRVFATSGGRFWQADTVIKPSSCVASEGDCLDALRAFDGRERCSPADSTDLAQRETIEVEFAAAASGDVGLVIASRQTLLSTFLFYQTLAYMGHSAAQWLAALERGNATTRTRAGGIGHLLGGIEVDLQDSVGNWHLAGETRETGPLATDVRLVPLPHRANSGPLKVRLRLTRGHWRIDYVALARLGLPIEPLRLQPSAVLRNGVADDRARSLLLDRRQPLTTMPGDEYTLTYQLPDHVEAYELFLESRGYYLEWMREEWFAEEDPARAAMMFLDPAGALRALAPAFKRVESEIEAVFWRSRYARQ